MKYEPMRMCVACRTRQTKNKLIRLINKNGELEICDNHIDGFRSVYICNSLDCFNLALKKKVFNRLLKKEIDNSLFEKLKEKISGKN